MKASKSRCTAGSFSSREKQAVLRGAVAVTTVVVAAACSVGPDYQPPPTMVPADFDSTTGAPTKEVPVDWAAEAQAVDWWSSFEDPTLVRLVERAMDGNRRVQTAVARLDEARAVRRARAGRLLPAVSSAASAGKSRASANGPGPLGSLAEAGLASLENTQYTAGFEAGWELDLFGGVRRGREAAQARLEATEENLRGVLLLVAAETANAYIDLRGAELRLELAQRNLDIQNQTLRVIDAKVESGLLAPIDFDRSKTQKAQLEAALSPLRAQRAAASHRLAVLTGENPGTLELGRAELPRPPGVIASGVPAELLMRRPDLRARERELQASTADVGAALADRFPQLTVGASYGFESENLGDLLQAASRVWSYGPRLDLPIFQGGRLAAQVEAARARLRAAEATFQQSLLMALEEVKTALVVFEENQTAQLALEKAAESSRSTSEHAGTLYELGLRDHLVLLDAQRSQTAIDDALALSRVEVARGAVSLYLALGGGWTLLEQRLEGIAEKTE